MYRWLIIIILIILLWAQTTNPSFANDLNFTIDNQTDGGTFNSLQDGEDNDIDFARSLAEHGDFYVNDAFSVSHRAHASTAAIANLLPSVAGRLMELELDSLTNAFMNPERPLIAIIGGSKISTKIDLLVSLSQKVDSIDTLFAGYQIFGFLHVRDIQTDSIQKIKKCCTYISQ